MMMPQPMFMTGWKRHSADAKTRISVNPLSVYLWTACVSVISLGCPQSMKHRVSDLSACVQGGYRAPASANPTAPPMPSAPGVPDYSANKAGIPHIFLFHRTNSLAPLNACLSILYRRYPGQWG